jgi:hypothetical protein
MELYFLSSREKLYCFLVFKLVFIGLLIPRFVTESVTERCY